jgi:Baseplate J-like protein
MPLSSPNLDDRDFDQLIKQARLYIEANCPTWTDFSAGDPGIVLLEAFAFLTETMIYRLNRVPEKAYIEFLRLVGVSLEPPSAGAAALTFTVVRPSTQGIEIPRGTRVTVARAEAGSDPIIFTTSRPATIPEGATEVASVLAHHCDLVQGELAGHGTGQPGLTLTASRPPLVALTGEDLDLVVGVEALPSELTLRVPAIAFNGKPFRIWRRVDNFAETGGDGKVYVADLLMGEIRFANSAQLRKPDGTLGDPRALGEAPAAGREIRLWYRRGGGPGGNVSAGTLTVLKDPIAGVQVNNPAPAAGGHAAETLANALVRGPLELRAPWRAVTARDFEVLALSRGVAARAKAFAQASLWKFAPPGTVETLLVPSVPDTDRPGGKATLQQLLDRQTPEALTSVRTLLDERRPLGVNSLVGWAKYKSVRVQARVVARDEEDVAAVSNSVLERLNSFINPLPSALQPTGWRFGEALRVSNIYDAALREAGVRYIDQVQLLLDDVPEADVKTVLADPFQPGAWYAAVGTRLFRSVNSGDGWEVARIFSRGMAQALAAHPTTPGLLALATRQQGEKGGSAVCCSMDCGETWLEEHLVAFDIESLAWTSRDGVPLLLMATSVGLYELSLRPDATPVQLMVFAGDQEHGFYAVAAATESRASAQHVAVASQVSGGVYASFEGGKAGTFQLIGLKGMDIRVLAVQHEGVRNFLWAGAAAASPGDNGTGCFSWELLASGNPPEAWIPFGDQWSGGSCKDIAFQGPIVLAGTHHAGVLRLPARRTNAVWERPSLDCGLPLREAKQLFHPVESVAVDPQQTYVLAAGPKGIFRSPATDTPPLFETCSARIFLDRVTLPPTGLFVSGEHTISVVREHEA